MHPSQENTHCSCLQTTTDELKGPRPPWAGGPDHTAGNIGRDANPGPHHLQQKTASGSPQPSAPNPGLFALVDNPAAEETQEPTLAITDKDASASDHVGAEPHTGKGPQTATTRPPVQPTTPTKSVSEMANGVLARLGKGTKVTKRPAAKLNKHELQTTRPESEPPLKARKTSLPYPGTDANAPQCIGEVTIYTSTKSQKWRVQKKGDKLDKAFSWSKNPRIRGSAW